MNKNAILDNVSPTQMALLSLLTGAGGFGGMKLLQDVMTAQQPNGLTAEDDKHRQLPVYLPTPGDSASMGAAPEAPGGTSIPQLKTADFMGAAHHIVNSLGIPGISHPELADSFKSRLQTAPPELRAKAEAITGPVSGGATGAGGGTGDPNATGSWLPKALLGGAGVVGGFAGSKMLYDAYQEHQMKRELETAKQQYIQQLQQAKMQKLSASKTPCFDGFCDMLDDMQKKAEQAGNPLAGLMHATPVPEYAKYGLGTIAALTALLSGGYMINQERQRREAELKKQYPSQVVLTGPEGR